MSLRLKLLLGLVTLVAVGLLVTDAATYYPLRSYLFDRMNQQLLGARQPVAAALTEGGQLPGAPPGTVGELLNASGSALDMVTFVYPGQQAPLPALPSPLPSASGQENVFTTGSAGGGSTRFRVLVQALPTPGGAWRLLVVAVPLTEVDQTLGRLARLESLVTALVLLSLAAFAWWLVRRDLRPLEDMATDAGRIAAGELSLRVRPAESGTEVGRLGLALNSMLEQIEAAFAARMATENRLRRFLAGASHELRTPLASIRGYAEIFRRGAKDDPQGLAISMQRIEEASSRMGLLVDDLLRLAHLGEEQRPHHVPVDLAAVAADAVRDARAVAPTRTITLQAPPSLVLAGDEKQLREVVANLLSNTQQHTPDGSPVTVSLAAHSGTAILDVSDEGPGMTEEQAARALEPFYRVDPSRNRATGGGGLGLAIVAAIVEAHGGEIVLRTVPGEGLTATVRLPLEGVAPFGDRVETGSARIG